MNLKSGTIIPFLYKDSKKLISIPSLTNHKLIYLGDVENAIYSAFGDLKNKFEFYNKKIGFQIPEELLIPYLEQRHDLTNFIVEIVELDGKCDQEHEDESIVTKSSDKRQIIEDSHKELKKTKRESIDQHLEDILKASTKGQQICNNFDYCDQLNEEDRTALIELVVNYEFENLPSKATIAIDTGRLCKLSAAIARRFPGEDPTEYFDEHSKSFKYIAGGRLYDQFLEKKIKCFQEMKRNRKYINNGTEEVAEGGYFPELEELKKINNDWPTYFRAWQYTFDLRIAYYRNSFDPRIYFEKLISNVHDKVHKLMEYDFERLHPQKRNNLFDNWEQLSERIFTEALVMGRNDVPYILDMYGHMSEVSGLMMLSYFVESYDLENHPFERDDPENLVIHIENIEGELVKFLKEYSCIHQMSTPLVFAVGKIEGELNFYVLVGSKLFKMEKVLKAVDFCFKCYQILELSYPSKQLESWQVIQNAFYDIQTEDGPKLSGKMLKILKSL